MIQLYVFPPSPRAFKVLAVAEHAGVPYQLCPVNLPAGEQRSPAFTALNPNQRMPVLQDGDFVLWEANAILQYLALQQPRSPLYPQELRRRLDVDRWLFWDLAHWDSACSVLIFERVVKRLLGLGAPDPRELARAEPQLQRSAAVLDAQLRGRRSVAADALTIADFALGAPLNLAAQCGFSLEPYPELARWYGELAQLPAWSKTLAPLAPRP